MSLRTLAAWAMLTLLLFGAWSAAAQAPSGMPEPPPPAPSAEIQKRIDAFRTLWEKSREEALALSTAGLEAARVAGDVAGAAEIHRLRGEMFQTLKRIPEAISAWQEAAAANAACGSITGQMRGLSREAILRAAEPGFLPARLRQLIALAREEKVRPIAAARQLNVEGVAFSSASRPADSLVLLRAALELTREREPNSLQQAQVLHNVGSVSIDANDLVTARDALTEAMTLRGKLLPGSRDLGLTVQLLADTLERMHLLQAARQTYELALGILEKLSPDSLDVAGINEKLSGIARTLGDLAAARVFAGKSVAITEQKAPDSLRLATSYTQLALVLQDQGESEAGATYHERALGIREKLAPNSLAYASSLRAMGYIALGRKQYQEAFRIFARSFGIEQKLSPGSVETALSMFGYGTAAYRTNDIPTARGAFKAAATILVEKDPFSPTLANVLEGLTHTLMRSRDWDNAEYSARLAWQIVTVLAGEVSGDEAKLAFARQYYKYLDLLVRTRARLGKKRDAFAALEEGRAQAMLQLLSQRGIIEKCGDPDRRRAHAEASARFGAATRAVQQAAAAQSALERAVKRLEEEGAPAAAIQAKKDEAAAAGLVTAAASLAVTSRRLEAEIAWEDVQKSAPDAFAARPTTEELQKALPEGVLYLAFHVSGSESYLFLVRGGTGKELEIDLQVLPIGRAALETQVSTLRRAVTRPDTDPEEALIAGRALADSLLPNVARAAMRQAKRIVISPDGPLWEAPFAALVVPGRDGWNTYLGIDKPLTYAQSLAVYSRSRMRKPAAAPNGPVTALVIGNPLFDPGKRAEFLAKAGSPATGALTGPVVAKKPGAEKGGGTVVAVKPVEKPVQLALAAPLPLGELRALTEDGKVPPQLPEAEKEAEAVARLYGARAFTGIPPTETWFREHCANASVIHLATHGYLHPSLPLSSGLLLAVPEKQPAPDDTRDDSALQAWEIFIQVRLNAELVVLSACETGRGARVPGEGLVGLTRALQCAGARSVVASGWKIGDHSSSRLMVRFHQGLRNGLPKDEALRQAMETLEKDPASAHPFHWAAFMLTGDPENNGLDARLGRR